MRTSVAPVSASPHLATENPRTADPQRRPTGPTSHPSPPILPALQEKILTYVLDIADQTNRDEQEAAYLAFIRLIHCWPNFRDTGFLTTARIRLVSRLLHETNSHVRRLIHDALATLKRGDPSIHSRTNSRP